VQAMDALELVGLLGLILCLVIGFSVPQFSGLSAAAISAVVSILVTRRYGGRWVYERQDLRDHALALAGDIESWAHSIKDHTWAGLSYTEYGPEEQSGIRRSPTGFYVLEASYPPLSYVKQLKEHFNTGYPSIAKAWQQLKLETTEHNRAVVTILNSVIPALNEVAEEFGALGVDGPTLAEHIYKESIAQLKLDYMADLLPASIVDRKYYSYVTIGSNKELLGSRLCKARKPRQPD